ncbi:MAG: hypothetical protein Q9195_006871 [Heterodermia aff. obscurata]
MSQSPAERWLCDLEERTHELVGRNRNSSHSSVKIALLDSGIDGTHSVFHTRRTRIKAFKSWVAEKVDEFTVEGLSKRILDISCRDINGHGTHKAALILRVAPWADLYIGRVVEDKDLEAANVATAISWAVSQWKVDIICLPLGFPRRIEVISSAITVAVQKVVIFAAASNKGLNCSGPAYPARDEKVICINSAHYNGGESDDNPEPIWGQNLSTLGENVTSAWPNALSSETNPESMKATSGTSVATAIAASIGALLLDFVRQDHEVATLRWAAERMRTMDGMKVVLHDMAKKINRFRYIEPFTYLDGSEDDADLGSFSRREHALSKIFQILRDEFEYKPIIKRLPTIAPSVLEGLGLTPSSGGNFVPMRLLGRGSYSTVEEVRESSTGVRYARKRIHLDSIIASEVIERRIINEIKIMQKLRHRHISTIAFWIKEDISYSLFIQPVADHDLQEYLNICAREYFPKAMTKYIPSWFGCLANALIFAHRLGIRHEDIKPSNILIKDGEPYLTDFGLAREISQVDMSPSSDHIIQGTRYFHPPEVEQEQTKGRKSDVFADVFALGCVYSEMYTIMKQKSLEEYREFRRSAAYRDCLPRVYGWLELIGDSNKWEYEVLFVTRGMTEGNPEIRLTMQKVSHSLQIYGLFFCHACSDYSTF